VLNKMDLLSRKDVDPVLDRTAANLRLQRAFTAAWAIEQPSLRVPGNGTQSSVSSSSMAGTRTLRAGTTVEMACL